MKLYSSYYDRYEYMHNKYNSKKETQFSKYILSDYHVASATKFK